MERIDFHKLEPNKMYYIDRLSNKENEHLKHTARFIKYMYQNRKKIACFDNIKNIQNSKYSKVSEGKGFRNENWEFYKVNKYDIIEKNENKTHNIILQNILKDPNFNWAFI